MRWCTGSAAVTILNRGVTVTGFDIVASTSVLGLDPDYVEAVAFAWFAERTLSGLTSSAGSVTGALGARILGGNHRSGQTKP
jgi:1,6-anhydro-N-acetylmuramate kinase